VKLGKKEGARGLYRGLTAAWGLQFCVNSTRFGMYAHTGQRHFVRFWRRWKKANCKLCVGLLDSVM
jgi:hypothetical protein